MLAQLTELQETHLPVYYSIKDMMKDTDEPPDAKEKAHRARSRRNTVQKEASVPVELGCAAPLAQGFVHQPGSSPNAILLVL